MFSSESETDEKVFILKTNYNNLIKKTITSRENWRIWTKCDDDNWDLIWADSKWMRENFTKKNGKKINHYENHFELSRKDLLNRNIENYAKKLKKQDKKSLNKLSFMPKTYALPNDYQLFLECEIKIILS